MYPTQPCSPGYYCRSGAQTAAPQQGADADKCPVGHYCPEMTVEPQQCPPGTFSNITQLMNITDCTTCTPGERHSTRPNITQLWNFTDYFSAHWLAWVMLRLQASAVTRIAVYTMMCMVCVRLRATVVTTVPVYTLTCMICVVIAGYYCDNHTCVHTDMHGLHCDCMLVLWQLCLCVMWWGCYDFCQRHKSPKLAHSFLYSSIYFSVFQLYFIP